MALPDYVKIVEVGPRDGLQNEKALVTTDDKIALIDMLSNSGLPSVEAGSFVSPKWVPQMADSAEVMTGIQRVDGVSYPVLTPNMRGLDGALAAGAEEVAIFGAASESFSKRNINKTIAESLDVFRPVVDRALDEGVKVRGYISCVLGCPYEGDVDPVAVAEIARELKSMGCYEVSLGDTIGVGTPEAARKMIEAVAVYIPIEEIGVHYHDTYGQALANLYASLDMGVAALDSSVAGLGGCPYAKGATGNVATEEVLFMLRGSGVETGVDFDKVLAAGRFISTVIGRPPASRVSRALAAKDAA